MEPTREPVFKRRARVGMSILNIDEKETVYVKINDFFDFNARDGRIIPAFKVTNLKTGEEQTMWVDGGLKGTLSAMGGPVMAVGMSLEITRTGKTQIEHEDKGTVYVNTYEVYELDDATL